MIHAFLITAYKNPAHLVQLINALDSPGTYFFIHPDKKSPLLHDPVFRELSEKKNVQVAPAPRNVNWAGISHLEAIIDLLRMAGDTAIPFDYFHTLSGADFPVKPVQAIDAFFERHAGKEFMQFMKLPTPLWTDGGFDRIKYYQLYDVMNPKTELFAWLNPRVVRLQQRLRFERSLPAHFTDFYGGYIWWSLSQAAINIVMQTLDKHPELLKRFRHCFCSEEILIPTILLNSALKDNVTGTHLRYIDWAPRNGNEPANLDETDFTAILNSDAIFARKFEYPVSEKLLAMVQQRIANYPGSDQAIL